MNKKRIVLATFNKDKVKEIQRILLPTGFELVSLDEFPDAGEIVEDGETLLENALKKAKASFRWTGLPSLADDTGLEVDALDGLPGVRSSRFAGAQASYRENNEKLLRLLQGVRREARTARFRTVVAYVDGERERWVEGICQGVILERYQGSSGFGYDPLFFVLHKNKTFAEMTTEEKNRISHRGIAFRKMADLLKNLE